MPKIYCEVIAKAISQDPWGTVIEALSGALQKYENKGSGIRTLHCLVFSPDSETINR